MGRTLLKSALLLLAAMAVALPAQAGIWLEHGDGRSDTGKFPFEAQAPTGTGSLECIYGGLSNAPNVDMYQIYIVDPAAFSATVIGSTVDDSKSNGMLTNSILYLFDFNSVAKLANNNASDTTLHAALPVGSAANLSPGLYYIAVAGFDTEPRGRGPNNNLAFIFDIPPSSAATPVIGPNAGIGPLETWRENSIGSNAVGGYGIQLTGAGFTNFVPASAVPEPGSLALLATGMIGLATYRWRRRWAAGT